MGWIAFFKAWPVAGILLLYWSLAFIWGILHKIGCRRKKKKL